jgi:hypothetical protein
VLLRLGKAGFSYVCWVTDEEVCFVYVRGALAIHSEIENVELPRQQIGEAQI